MYRYSSSQTFLLPAKKALDVIVSKTGNNPENQPLDLLYNPKNIDIYSQPGKLFILIKDSNMFKYYMHGRIPMEVSKYCM